MRKCGDFRSHASSDPLTRAFAEGGVALENMENDKALKVVYQETLRGAVHLQLRGTGQGKTSLKASCFSSTMKARH